MLVAGIRKNEHCERFEPGGKYHSSVIPGSEYVIIDMRSNTMPRVTDERVTYVDFSEKFTSATIMNKGSPIDVPLNNEVEES